MENESEVSSSVGSKSVRKNISYVWKTFEKFVEEGKEKAKCKKCGQIYASGLAGTTNLKRHIRDICPFREQSGVEFLTCEFDQGIFREKVAKAIIKHDYPFKFVEHEGIRDVFSYLNHQVQHVSRNTAKCDVLQIYEMEKEKIKGTLASISSRICLTSDLWSSIASNGYMTITAHYVDNNWVLQKKLLIFRHLPPPHDGQHVGERLISFLQEWGIERKVFTITLDNAKYNDGVVDLLRKHLSLTKSLLCGGDFLHIRCGAHVLNLVVQAGLKIIDICVEKIRDSVKYVRGSEARMIRFAECVKQLGLKTSKKLKQDMPIRWNSTYLMLDSAILYSQAFFQLNIIDSNYKWCPSDEEWSRVRKITEFLKPFHNMTELFSGNQYPTANLYFCNVWHIQMLIQEEMENIDPVISNMAKEMKPKFDKYWESYSTVLTFAVILDPRYKLSFVQFCYGKLDHLTAIAKTCRLREQLHLLFEEYLHASPSMPEQSSIASSSSVCHDKMNVALDEFDTFVSEIGDDRNQSQLELYLKEPLLDRKQFPHLDILDYWRGNSTRYPELALMARDIMSIPITTVASESAFSHGGRIIGKFRSSILPKNAEGILCSRDWLQACSFENEEEEEELSTDMEKLVNKLGSSSIHK